MRLAADIGGTFTDIAAFDPSAGVVRYGKALTTPVRLIDGVNDGTAKAGVAVGACDPFLHGTTIAINTVLERTGARTALLTTRGFRDIYEIGRVNRPEAYNLYFRRHQPLVDRALRFEIDERMMADGSVLQPLDEEEVRSLARELGAMGVEAVAILFLHSYRNPAHEIRAAEIVAEECPHVFVTASHQLSQEYREFERTSTVAANAYVGPRVRRYLREFEESLSQQRFAGSFLIVQSSGGLFEVDVAERECIRMLESGPAAGLIGTRTLVRELGLVSAIGFDMGGTTAKAGVVHENEVLMTSTAKIGGYEEGLPIQIPMIDIQEVGTGGGSIARVVEGGALRVGPQSAGAFPGPVSYGRGGTEPTVTDANLLLGRLGADSFLGGEMPLDAAAAEEAMRRRVADPLGLTVIDASEGILRIAADSMAHVVRRVTTERGLEASRFALVAYGGAGPLHAAEVARDLGIGTVIIPHAPGHFSAYGMLAADLRKDFVQTSFMPLEQTTLADLDTRYAAMEDEGRRALAGNPHIREFAVSRAADMRYVGQEHAVTVDLPVALFAGEGTLGIKRQFDDVHSLRYGYAAPDEKAEIVSLRTSAIGIMPKPPHAPLEPSAPEPAPDALRTRRPIVFRRHGAPALSPVYTRAALRPGNVIHGPAVVEEYASTTVVHPGDRLTVDGMGNLVIEIGKAR